MMHRSMQQQNYVITTTKGSQFSSVVVIKVIGINSLTTIVRPEILEPKKRKTTSQHVPSKANKQCFFFVVVEGDSLARQHSSVLLDAACKRWAPIIRITRTNFFSLQSIIILLIQHRSVYMPRKLNFPFQHRHLQWLTSMLGTFFFLTRHFTIWKR